MRILLVAREGAARDAYMAALERLGVEYDALTSFSEILGLAGDKAYSGLLLDILTLVRTRKEEKSIAYECINYYPAARIKWDAGSGRINLFFFDNASSDESETALETFIEERCRIFSTRTVRKFTRKEVVLNVRLGREAVTVAVTGERTFSTNMSRSGAFIQTVEAFSKGEDVWLRFEELFEKVPVRGEVRWCQAWGERRAIPGIGVKLIDLTEAQATDLNRLLKGC